MKNNNKKGEKMKFSKMMVINAVLSGCLLLTACHNNPLERHTQEENARAFMAAAEGAENQLHIQQDSKGVSYRMCMEGIQGNFDCKDFFNQMLFKLKSKPGYKSLTLDELTSTSTWNGIKEDYKSLLFNAID